MVVLGLAKLSCTSQSRIGCPIFHLTVEDTHDEKTDLIIIYDSQLVFYQPYQGGASFVDHLCYLVFVMLSGTSVY